MKTISSNLIKFLLSIVAISALASNASGDIVLDSDIISVSQPSGGGFLAGTAMFDLTGIDPLDVELLASFDIVDAGVEIRINGTSLYPDFIDISQFGPEVVFLDTGVTQGTGNVENPFSPNNSGLDRLIVSAASDGTEFSGAAFVASTSVVDYTPNFAVQDFSSLLVDGDNTIEFFVLNGFEGANLQGDFTVTQIVTTAPVPEPSSFCLLLFVGASFLSRRRK